MLCIQILQRQQVPAKYQASDTILPPSPVLTFLAGLTTCSLRVQSATRFRVAASTPAYASGFAHRKE